MSIPPLNPIKQEMDAVEQIALHVTRSWLENKQIVVFRVTSVARGDVDSWIECVKQTMSDWDKDHPYLAIHDFNYEGVSLTPYARSRSQELIPINTGTRGYAAIILPRTYVSQLIRMFLLAQKQQGNENASSSV